MKIWIDFINTPQVTFFVPFIKEFKDSNHEVLLTCRDSGNTIDLLLQHKLHFEVIGNKAGKGMIQKLLYFPARLVQLFAFIRKQRPDIAVSQSSFYQPLVARLLGIPSLYTNDNEHAKGNLVAFMFAKKVVLPVALSTELFLRRKALRKKVSFYPSVKEAIYLSQDLQLRKLASGKKEKIYFRPEPWSAQYYDGPLNFFDEVLLKLSQQFEVIILPRDRNQSIHYDQEKFKRLKVAQKPLGLTQIMEDCRLFIGAGGSMTREMAVMEVPVISIYQSDLLCVDKYLIDKGLMIINPKITYEEIKAYLDSDGDERRDWQILKEGEASYYLIKNMIYKLKDE